ncbi:hypothetical protein CGMCC3_g9970 [Colletotrichum fructicola]|nr:uncharacterized protein CGMCC3_g9970 [Colletotrichum fructicola]KAE9574188.1 hypothetical protein CGMCC3_g9970 [Colletotrichum fructicola]
MASITAIIYYHGLQFLFLLYNHCWENGVEMYSLELEQNTNYFA